MLNPAVKIWLYNGDWDDVVPFPDTLKNLDKMNIKPIGPYKPWFVHEDHAGFYQAYSGLTLITVKGAGHMVLI
jgi:serine carboxypeptidase-like clade 2